MKLKKIKEGHNYLKVLIKDSNNEFVNAVRRLIMTEVPILAVDNVSIYKNDTVMFDEFLAHRIAMIPLETDLKAYKKGDSVKLTLKEKGPKMVYSKDIKCVDPKIKVAYENVPIIRLEEGQELKIELTATMGNGREHAKWQPALVYFKEVPELVPEGKVNLSKITEKVPKELIEINAGKVFLKDPYSHDFESYIEDLSEEGITVKYKDKDFVFTIESYGNIDAKDCLIRAAEVLEEKIKELGQELKDI